ncbi:MFS transporter [Amycolatopsis sp. NPDC051372]|uniref:MFS transporter n=1 Tax=Amycolatopsis sp. NPDC051372 TaxID=3155669 RepID=UPI003433572D
MTTQEAPLQRNQANALITRAKNKIEQQENVGSTRAGWLMISTLLIEAWDLYSLAFILVFLKDLYHPSTFLLAFTSAGLHIGGMIGSVLGGYLTDRFGRRKIFLASMIVFAVLAVAQGFAPSMLWLAVIRVLAGVPFGADIPNGFTYMMEVLPRAKREVMANRWQSMFAFGTVIAAIFVTILMAADVSPNLLWRIVLAFPAIPAVVLIFLRSGLPETPAWLLDRGRFLDAKEAARPVYGDVLDFLPDENVIVERPSVREVLSDLRTDKFRRRASIFGWVANFNQSGEFWAFSFYVPFILVSVGLSNQIGSNLFSIGVNIVAAIAATIGPLLLRKIGHRGLTRWGAALTTTGLVVAAIGMFNTQVVLVVVGAAVMLWGHYWDNESGQTVLAVVARPRYRGTLSGLGNLSTKTAAFVAALVFPLLFSALGIGWAALITAIFPITTWLVATFVLPEVYGFSEAGEADDNEQAHVVAGGGEAAGRVTDVTG